MLLSCVQFLHLTSLVVWIGSIVFFSFFAAPSIFKILGKELAGDVVGDIFPKYWLIGYVCSTIALGSLISLWKTGMSGILFRVILLSVMFVSTFYTGLCIGSTARDLKAQMRTTEEGEKREDLRKQFSKLHRRSMIMNVLILILGVITLFMTAVYMRPKGAY
ncbi:MAG: DUF4149 domain-containing protein [Candidatus Scalindua sp. AMX11]|nr:MAG: DUF4149 domain-containing protein [Candidatus Scalindua sp.]NOG84967.1 DUF4149 domain-containing protein [Planctomycetota bacterium]RZV93022.1 MAG: DUF4149 domain-containing protein [Candidatus Scalindua sp. SCAELEC01]TDE66642.1 MAG: DUF4149 domain-containing protein [Candidatus Scalindua sp. AMX11]GJQ57950.1 MAG: hypothetical protein SCALA701_07510 [Candidatus Scalindua sp.]